MSMLELGHNVPYFNFPSVEVERDVELRGGKLLLDAIDFQDHDRDETSSTSKGSWPYP
jgi:hypothetical protein